MHSASIQFAPLDNWPRKKKTAGTLTLDFDARHRRRIRLTADQGEDVLLDLPKAIAIPMSGFAADREWKVARSTPPRSPSSKSTAKILMNLRGFVGIWETGVAW